jgi:hypothetical protein
MNNAGIDRCRCDGGSRVARFRSEFCYSEKAFPKGEFATSKLPGKSSKPIQADSGSGYIFRRHENFTVTRSLRYIIWLLLTVFGHGFIRVCPPRSPSPMCASHPPSCRISVYEAIRPRHLHRYCQSLHATSGQNDGGSCTRQS